MVISANFDCSGCCWTADADSLSEWKKIQVLQLMTSHTYKWVTQSWWPARVGMHLCIDLHKDMRLHDLCELTQTWSRGLASIAECYMIWSRFDLDEPEPDLLWIHLTSDHLKGCMLCKHVTHGQIQIGCVWLISTFIQSHRHTFFHAMHLTGPTMWSLMNLRSVTLFLLNYLSHNEAETRCAAIVKTVL